MSGDWRPLGLTIALVLAGAGLLLWLVTRNPALLIVGVIALVTLLLERRYRRPVAGAPLGPGWTRTGERFVDPETGLLTEVWFHGATGERRYIAARD